MRKLLVVLITVSLFSLFGCDINIYPKNYVEGIVVKEYGSVAKLIESSGAFFGNESVKLGNPCYWLIVDTVRGRYTIEIDVEDCIGSSGPKTAYNLALVIEEGTKIRFPTEFTNLIRQNSKGNMAGFNQRIGILDPDDIEILYQK